MTRKTQDIITWAVALVILLSQGTPWVPQNPSLIAAAAGLLGLPLVRRAQDAMTEHDEEKPEGKP